MRYVRKRFKDDIVNIDITYLFKIFDDNTAVMCTPIAIHYYSTMSVWNDDKCILEEKITEQEWNDAVNNVLTKCKLL